MDNDALKNALLNGEIAGAGLDVYTPEPLLKDNPLLDERLKNKLILTPHIAGITDFTVEKIYKKIAENTQNIILKKEYRYCYGRDLIEIPAGGFERGEEGLEVAKRELLEETGYISEDWQFIGRTVESSAKLTNYMHIYFADHCRKVSGQHLDATEEIEVLVMPLEQAVSMVMDNEICCNSSAHGILWAARKCGI